MTSSFCVLRVWVRAGWVGGILRRFVLARGRGAPSLV